MNKLISLIVIAVLSATSVSSFGLSRLTSPAGLWLARSPFFGSTPLGLVKISIVNNRACGELVQVYPLNGTSAMFNRRARSGPIVMCGYQLSSNRWVNGKLYEQTTAMLYSSEFRVSANGKHIIISGYSGPFSKSATWDRIR